MKLEGKVAIVTAAGKGIALALAEEGADMVVNSFLPGIGPYSAKAILCLGFGSHEATGALSY